MSDEEKRLLSTYFELEVFGESLPDIPKNKRLKTAVKYLSYIFRYKWELRKAEDSVTYWREQVRIQVLELRDKQLLSKAELKTIKEKREKMRKRTLKKLGIKEKK